MTDSKALARPPQVTMAGWVSIVGSVFIVFGMYDAVAGLRSLDTQQQVERMLSEPPLDGTGISVQEWLTVLHVVSLVAAACAAAAAILGWHVLRRSKPARVALSVVAVPLFLTGLVTGDLLSSLVCVSAVLLWTRPARDWFNGIAPPRPAAAAPARDVPPEPRPVQHFGTPPAQRPAFVTRRPDSVLYACLTTWITCGVVVLGLGVALATLVGDPGILDDLREQEAATLDRLDLSDGELRAMVFLTVGLVMAWALTAIGLAVLTFLRHDWARILLIISAVPAALLALTAITAVVPLVPAAACVFTVVQLLRPDARAWFNQPRP